jgi:hyperosmotically inducible periplasmic protein
MNSARRPASTDKNGRLRIAGVGMKEEWDSGRNPTKVTTELAIGKSAANGKVSFLDYSSIGEMMMNRTKKIGTDLMILSASLLLSGSLIASPGRQSSLDPSPDNSKTNQGDASKGAVTADQQKINPADQSITKSIRSAIVQDKTLSTYAHNIKIITQDGKVTLKGPVRSDDEKANIEGKAAAVAGADNVMDQLTIAPPK